MHRPRVAPIAAALPGLATAILPTDCHAQCELTLLAPDDLTSGDGYGVSAAISADHALVGAYDAVEEAGRVYALRRVDGRFVIDAKLKAADADAFDQFGSDVALSGTLAVIGAPLDEANGFASGSAYVFELVDDRWIQRDKLLAPDGSAYDLYALATATNAEHALVGCPEDDDVAPGAGSVYVYVPDGDAWGLAQKVIAPDAAAADRFGEALDADADTLVVGASQKATGVPSAGAAYVYVLAEDQWHLQQQLLPPQPAAGAEFGIAVSVSADLAAIGAPGDSTGAKDAGAVHVYRRTGASWTHEAVVIPDDVAAGDSFGSAVSIDADTLLVGSRAQDPDSGIVGAAYLYRRAPGGEWALVQRFRPMATLDAFYFGWAVAHHHDGAVIGAPFGTGPDPETGSSFVIDLAQCVCAPDLNLDGELTLLDFLALQAAFLEQDPAADVNRDGVLSVLDFVAFQALFLAGCP